MHTPDDGGAGALGARKADGSWFKDQLVDLALSAGKIGIFEWDLISGEIAWSAHHYLMFEVEPGSEITYETFRCRVHPDDIDGLEQSLAAAKAARALYEHDYRIVLPRAGTRTVSAKGRYVFNVQGAPVLMAGVVIDTTEATELRAQLAQR